MEETREQLTISELNVKRPKSPKGRKSPLSISDPNAFAEKPPKSESMPKMSRNSKLKSQSLDVNPPKPSQSSQPSLLLLQSSSNNSSTTSLMNNDKRLNVLEFKLDTQWQTYRARISPITRTLELYLELDLSNGTKKNPTKKVSLSGATILSYVLKRGEERPTYFVIRVSDGSECMLRTRSRQEKQEWISALRKYTITSPDPIPSRRASDLAAVKRNSPRHVSRLSTPTEEQERLHKSAFEVGSSRNSGGMLNVSTSTNNTVIMDHQGSFINFKASTLQLVSEMEEEEETLKLKRIARSPSKRLTQQSSTSTLTSNSPSPPPPPISNSSLIEENGLSNSIMKITTAARPATPPDRSKTPPINTSNTLTTSTTSVPSALKNSKTPPLRSKTPPINTSNTSTTSTTSKTKNGTKSPKSPRSTTNKTKSPKSKRTTIPHPLAGSSDEN